MCLHKVDKTFSKNDKFIVGYKIFLRGKVSGRLAPMFRQDTAKIYLPGVVYKSVGNKLVVWDKGRYHPYFRSYYSAGFHAYSSFEAIKHKCYKGHSFIYEVHLWDIRAVGTELNRQMYVGKNMRIIRRVK